MAFKYAKCGHLGLLFPRIFARFFAGSHKNQHDLLSARKFEALIRGPLNSIYGEALIYQLPQTPRASWQSSRLQPTRRIFPVLRPRIWSANSRSANHPDPAKT